MAEDQSHARTYHWLEPSELAATTGPLSGEQYLVAWTGGELAPPMATTLGFGLTGFGDGHVEIRCTPDEYHYNPYGTVHGGLAATLLDSATGCAIQSRLPAGAGYATLSLAVSYLRPITTATGELRCIGKVVSMGRTVAVSEADLLDGSGRTLAVGTATCLLMNPDPT